MSAVPSTSSPDSLIESLDLYAIPRNWLALAKNNVPPIIAAAGMRCDVKNARRQLAIARDRLAEMDRDRLFYGIEPIAARASRVGVDWLGYSKLPNPVYDRCLDGGFRYPRTVSLQSAADFTFEHIGCAEQPTN